MNVGHPTWVNLLLGQDLRKPSNSLLALQLNSENALLLIQTPQGGKSCRDGENNVHKTPEFPVNPSPGATGEPWVGRSAWRPRWAWFIHLRTLRKCTAEMKEVRLHILQRGNCPEPRMENTKPNHMHHVCPFSVHLGREDESSSYRVRVCRQTHQLCAHCETVHTQPPRMGSTQEMPVYHTSTKNPACLGRVYLDAFAMKSRYY